MSIKSIIMEALGPVRPRWWGDFSPTTRGPITYGSLGEFPIPLPTTVVGGLATALLKGSHKLCDTSKIDEDPLFCQERVLDQLGILRVKGPFLGFKNEQSIIPLLPFANYFRSFTGECYSVDVTERIGIGLERYRKTVKESYLYTEQLAWSVRGSSNVSSYTILVDLEIKNNEFEITNPIFVGGERQAFNVEAKESSIVIRELQSIWGDNIEKPITYMVIMLATPLLLNRPREKIIYVTSLTPYESVVSSLYEIFQKSGLSPKGLNLLSRCKIAGLGVGYDLTLNLPRPYLPALLPGCTILVEFEEGIKPLDLYLNGLGVYTRLGWGTIIPLPANTLDNWKVFNTCKHAKSCMDDTNKNFPNNK